MLKLIFITNFMTFPRIENRIHIGLNRHGFALLIQNFIGFFPLTMLVYCKHQKKKQNKLFHCSSVIRH